MNRESRSQADHVPAQSRGSHGSAGSRGNDGPTGSHNHASHGPAGSRNHASHSSASSRENYVPAQSRISRESNKGSGKKAGKNASKNSGKNASKNANFGAAGDTSREAIRFSRTNSAADYSRIRKKRVRKKRVLIGVCITLFLLLISASAATYLYVTNINNQLSTDMRGTKINFEDDLWLPIFVAPQTPEEPFWVLLIGTDDTWWMTDIPRSDTIILARIDQPNKRVALISLNRDLYVYIPGYGYDKINAAYTWGEIYGDGGVQMLIRTVSEFAGVDISYFALVNFDGFQGLVDALGGVEVDVPVDIVGDREAGDVDIYRGYQVLDGKAALTFVRSRRFDIGDYQRAANQRTFLQAVARKVLSDPSRITASITTIADMTFTNMDLQRILNVAYGMQGLQESDIHTYYVPSYYDSIPMDDIDVSILRAYTYEWRDLINDLKAGNYPPPQDSPFTGEVPDGYIAAERPPDGEAPETPTLIFTNHYLVDVRNGNSIEGSARSVSDYLHKAGYRVGKLGDMDDPRYETTLIIYGDISKKPVAEDIRRRLGYGRLVPSNGNYEFYGDILIIVGKDFREKS